MNQTANASFTDKKRMGFRNAKTAREAGRAGLVVLLVIAIAVVAAVLWLKMQWERPGRTAPAQPDYIRSVPVTVREPRTQTAPAGSVSPQSAVEKLRSVFSQMQKLNPGFDPVIAGTKHTMEDGQVVELSFSSAGLTNVSPVAALTGLRALTLDGPPAKSPLADLSPLRGMSLTRLSVKNTSVADLSPLRGMPLDFLDISSTAVSDLTPLASMPLTALKLDMTMVRTKRAVQVLLEEIGTLRTINDLPVGDFLQQAATASGLWSRGIKPVEDKFVTAVMAMPVEKQLPVVLAKLKELNPAFDGVQQHKIEAGQITELYLSTANVKDIGPLRALQKLKRLSLSQWAGNNPAARGVVSDLSALRGMALTMLACHSTDVSDLSPLRGMPLTILSCGSTQVSDLSPLTGMRLTVLSVDNTPVSDLAPLAGMPLTVLWCDRTKVTNLSPLSGMPLTELRCDFDRDRDYEVLHSIRTLTKVNDTMAAMFWMTASQPSGAAAKRSKKTQ
jgi:Leucine-rich repeat (LRR) protein